MTEMKVLFLDVDGVITYADGSGRLCEEKLERLQRVVLPTQTQIVISSNWRLFPQLKDRLVNALHEHGGMRVIGSTPDNGERVHGDAVRPEEILSWLKAWQGEPIEAWCAVDDRPLLMERGGAGLIGHFVEVDEMFGLTELAVERVLAVLHTEPDDPEVMDATSSAVAAAKPDGDRLSPDSVLNVQPLSSASQPPTPQRLGVRASEEHLALDSPSRALPPRPRHAPAVPSSAAPSSTPAATSPGRKKPSRECTRRC